MTSRRTFVVVLNWNRREDTLRCLESVRRLDPPADRVILVDNASTDGTPQAVAERFPEFEFVVNAHNLGFAGGMNSGLQAALDAGAEFVLMLNNDTWVAADLLWRLLDAAGADPRIGIVAPKIYFAEPPDRIWYAGAFRRPTLPGFSFPGYGRRDRSRYGRRRDVDYATGCGLLVRAEVLRQVGLFDAATFFMYHEDLDLSERVRAAGYRILYEPEARMWHRESASTGRRAADKWTYLARYIVPFFGRYYRRPRPSLLLYAVSVVIRELLKGHPDVILPYLRGLREGWRAQW